MPYKNIEDKRLYYKNHYEKLKVYNREYKKLNKDKIAIYNKKYNEINKDKIALHNKNYKEKNKDKINNYQKTRFAVDSRFKLHVLLRSRFYMALSHGTKLGSAVKDLGCSIEELRVHIESQFKEGMSWDNWGRNGWHLDHIKPISLFNLTDKVQLLEACNYKNLQPLWWYENIAKSNHIY